jgi:serine/threonine protein kinase
MKLLQAADWWSVGVIAYELVTGVNPFAVNDSQEVIK